jgi:hypothetical protein
MLSYKVQSSKYRETVKTVKIYISNTQLILNRVIMYTDYVKDSNMLRHRVHQIDLCTPFIFGLCQWQQNVKLQSTKFKVHWNR